MGNGNEQWSADRGTALQKTKIVFTIGQSSDGDRTRFIQRPGKCLCEVRITGLLQDCFKFRIAEVPGQDKVTFT